MGPDPYRSYTAWNKQKRRKRLAKDILIALALTVVCLICWGATGKPWLPVIALAWIWLCVPADCGGVLLTRGESLLIFAPIALVLLLIEKHREKRKSTKNDNCRR